MTDRLIDERASLSRDDRETLKQALESLRTTPRSRWCEAIGWIIVSMVVISLLAELWIYGVPAHVS